MTLTTLLPIISVLFIFGLLTVYLTGALTKTEPQPEPEHKPKTHRYSQHDMITIFNCCKTALELLESRQTLEETGHVLYFEANAIYDIRMSWLYETDRIV